MVEKPAPSHCRVPKSSVSNLLGIRELLSCQNQRHTPDCSVNIYLFLQAPIIPKSKKKAPKNKKILEVALPCAHILAKP